MRIAHIMIFEKFNRRYIEFVDTHFNINDHVFYIIGTNYANYDVGGLKQVVLVNSYPGVVKMFFQLIGVKKIFLHGLWHRGFLRLLLGQPWLIPKCYWMMWGGDFYYHKRESAVKKKLIKKIRHFVSLVEGDFELVKKWYGASGTFHQSILYTYLSADEFEVPVTGTETSLIRILVGNSADPSNNHVEVFQLLQAHLQHIEEVVVPLSYGNSDYANEVIEAGRTLFGDKFTPLTGLISLEAYRAMLRHTDIAVFNHNRQQGLGNLIALLSYGKKVYLRPDVTTWHTFTQLGLALFDVKTFEPKLLDASLQKKNVALMKRYFSAAQYREQLAKLFFE